MDDEKQRIAQWRAKRRQERFEQERGRSRTRQFAGHFFLADDDEESIDPADAAADAEEQALAQRASAPAEPSPRLSSSEPAPCFVVLGHGFAPPVVERTGAKAVLC